MAKQGVPSGVLLWAVVVLLSGVCVVEVVGQMKLDGAKLHNYNDPVQYKDCGQLHKAGYNTSGAHVLYMNETAPFLIHCEFKNNQAYNVILRRVDNSQSFARYLQDYQLGFGSVVKTGWLGLDNIYHLTSAGNTILTINMQDWRYQNKNARYNYFKVADHTQKYRMFVSGFSSGDGLHDEMAMNSGMYFTTIDYPDVNGCVHNMKGGWWYNYCTTTLPTGFYYPPGHYTPRSSLYDGMYWQSFDGLNYSLRSMIMSVSSR